MVREQRKHNGLLGSHSVFRCAANGASSGVQFSGEVNRNRGQISPVVERAVFMTAKGFDGILNPGSLPILWCI
ncbi:MAG: hypothetical protein EBS01_02065 [Verrucomicrobia bacterium]|nr:hypothetical protein [Verrucomicrobiota bacterium]